MNKKCLLGGVYNYDTILQREYPDGFVVGKKNKFVDKVYLECIGGTCGNVSCMLPALGVETYPIAHFDLSDQGRASTEDLKHYKANLCFVKNDVHGGTALYQCTHKQDDKTGKHIMTMSKMTSAESQFPIRKTPHYKKEVPRILQALDFVPDVFFFDYPEAGYRIIAEELKEKGTLIYFEPENMKDESKFNKSVSISDIIKFSHENIPDVGIFDNYQNKLFVQTQDANGLQFRLRNGNWIHMDTPQNDNVVDWEGAGDWLTSKFIALLCEADELNVATLTEETVSKLLAQACETASKSVSYMSSKGMLDAANGGPRKKKEYNIPAHEAPTRGIIGAICGDVIGSIYERRGYNTKDVNMKLFRSGSKFTDDTIMTIALAQWLCGERTSDRLVDSIVEMGSRYPGRKNGYGRYFPTWVKSENYIPYKAASNGSAMRVSPVGWVADTLEETLALAKQSADVTHNTEEAEKGAMSVAAAIFLARTGKSKAEIKTYIEQTFGYDLNRKVEDVRRTYEFSSACSKSVPEAILCWLQSSSYEEAIRNAIALGGDADTQAAIAGAIAAATPGMEVPREIAAKAITYLTNIQKKVLLEFNAKYME